MSHQPILGVDLGGTKVSVGRVAEGRIIEERTREVSALAAAQVVIDEIIETIEGVFDSSVAGIGVGVPGLVDVEKGVVFEFVNIPSWREVALGRILEEKFHVPVRINNDANCFAVGEKHFGQGKSFRDLVGLTLGTGMGAGLIINGTLYSGHNCGAGEFGMIPYRDSDYESYCSGKYFISQHAVSGKLLHERAVTGDRQALEIFDRFGEHVGHACHLVLYAVDPEVIILGGSVSSAFPFFEAGMRRTLSEFAYKRTLSRIEIRVSQEPRIAVLGAAALCLDRKV